MTHKTATVVVSSAVATSGTITVSYPAGTSAGAFAAYGHKAFARGLQKLLTQDAGDISAAFGASDITVTYNGTTSIPANTTVTFELNIAGSADAPDDLIAPKRVIYDGVMRIDLGAPDTADANGVIESQDYTAAGVWSVLAFNGVYGDTENNEKAVFDVPRNVVAAWTATAVLTITGKDEHGDVIVENSASGTSHTGKKAFKEITALAVSANVTSITVGTGDVLGLPVYVSKVGQIIGELQDDVLLSSFNAGKILLPFVFDETDLLAPVDCAIVAPCAGYITGIRGVVNAAVTTGGAITVTANTVTVVGLSVTVADAAGAGVTHSDSIAKIATGLVAAGDDIAVVAAAAFATAGRYQGYLIFEPISELNGTFVAGVQTTPTALTGDVKGTYDPSEVCDGSLSFSLIVMVPDPSYKGVDNFDG